MRKVEMDHKARVAWVKSGDITVASFAFDAWGGANGAQMAAERYIHTRDESPWELVARIKSLEVALQAADAAIEDALGRHQVTHIHAALAAYREARHQKGYDDER